VGSCLPSPLGEKEAARLPTTKGEKRLAKKNDTITQTAETAQTEVYVTFPSRAFGAGSERRFFDYLRSVEGDAVPVKALKQAIVDAYRVQAAAAA